MKIIFLDIDGVLNSERSARAHDGYPHDFDQENSNKFDWTAVSLIRQACKETGAQIVLSSSWRIIHTTEQVAKGLDLPIIDSTPRISTYRDYIRGDEIDEWLKSHPEVSSYVIIDDNSDMRPEQKPFFVQTDFRNGLLVDDYLQVVFLLGELPKEETA